MNEKEDFLKMMQSLKAKKILAPLKIFSKLAIVALVAVVFFGNCIFYVRPNEFAIKQINIGINSGIREKVYTTGFHVIAPFGIHIMHRFPKDLQVFELNDYLETKAKSIKFNLGRSQMPSDSYEKNRDPGESQKSAHIQTSDGFFVDVDVSIIYHIVDPYKVITTVGPGKLYQTNGIVPKVEPILKETLGEMTTEEFFNSSLRVSRAQQAKELLNIELKPKGIAVENVLIRYFKYSDEIQRNIEEKKLKDQLVFTNQSKAKASAEEALVKKVREEGEANIKIKLEQGQAYVVKKNAERDLYVRTKHAEGDLMVKLAEAKKKELINNAYQQKGSDKLVGLKMAEVLNGLSVIMLSSSGENGFNPLNLEKGLELFGVKGGKE
ncbi:MAG: SPFH domain-containing protein [Candidatus Omnitrophica bacterium]|nr:SPFH domain-containing protein [Candidatus Omnitrophota bacterium]